MSPIELYSHWLKLWNGDLDLATKIISPECVVHQAPFSPSDTTSFRGSEGIRQMVEMGRAPFSDITFEAEVGPIIVDNLISARWKSLAIYRGGIPGAKAATGTALVYHGMDIMRIEHGKIAEYWVSADVYHLMAQLGAVS